MRVYILKRLYEEAEYIIKEGATVRKTAKVFTLSKSTVHKDMTERLILVDKKLYSEVKKVLKKNLDERHIRGGIATKQKYEKLKNLKRYGY